MNISEIIINHLLGKSTDEEERMLESWRKQSEENELMFKRLTTPDYLEAEWHKRKAVNYAKAEEQMKQRIGKERPLWLRPAFYRSAAAVAMLLVCSAVAVYLYNNNMQSPHAEVQLAMQEWKAGEMKAVLTKGNGEVIELREPLIYCNDDYDDEGTDADSKNEKYTLSVPRGGEFKVELEDGTEVWLNAQSKLIYPETFSKTERRVIVEGEAYFKVAKNEAKPFYVEADNQIVRVVGTEFNVNAYSEDKVVQTTLVSGKIAMQQKGNADREMILTPGHQAVFDKTQRNIKVKSVDTEVVTSWKDGMFVFEDQDLASIMKTLSRWYDFEYEFKDNEAAQTVFMGRIPRYSDFADVIQIIEMSGGLKLKLSQRKLTISSTK